MAVRPNMERNQALAGQSVRQGNYTITYNDAGYATSARKDGGKSANAVVKTTHANDSADHKAAYEAAQRGDWDAVGTAINRVGAQSRTEDGSIDMAAANQYMQELQNQFGYDAKTYYDQQYDKVHGNGSAAVYDATGGAVKTYEDLVRQVGAQKAEQIATQPTSSQLGMQAASSLPGLSLSTGMTTSAGGNDMTKYLEAMYAQNLEAELAALKSAYDNNVAELESRNDQIAEQYRAARNQAAAQNALEQQSMNERALATGLNTGTSGQIALAQNMAYQGNLGNLWAQEAQDKAQSDLALAQLMRDYTAGVNQTTANINAQRAQAIYNEMIRQQELAAAQQAAQLEQERYEREWLYEQEQDRLALELAYAQLAAKQDKKETPNLTARESALRTGAYWDADNGVLTWNGKAYTQKDIRNGILKRDITAANLSEQEKTALDQSLILSGLPTLQA